MSLEPSALSISTNSFASLLFPQGSTTSLPNEITRALEFFQQPTVQQLVADLQRAVFEFMVKTSLPLHAIDWQTPDGIFVREGVRELLISPQIDSAIPLMLNRFGRVFLTAEGRNLAVGTLYLAVDSPMLREDFVNKSSSQHAEKPVFQIEQIDSWVPISDVLSGDPSGIVLNEEQSLAAEIVMTMDYMFVYARIAQDIAVNEQDAGQTLLRMKVGANLDDSLGAASYCRDLESRVEALTARLGRQTQRSGLSGPLTQDTES